MNKLSPEAEAITTTITSFTTALQLLVMALEESEALPPGRYQEMLANVIDSPGMQAKERQPVAAFLSDLLDRLED